MSFANPTYLWALLGLIIPLAIHLWSKKEGKTIKIGSTKLLSQEDSKQSSSISLNELLLLVFRFLIIGLVVLILAEPQLKRETKNTPLTYIVEPSLLNDHKITSLIDSLKKEFPVVLLKKEFPKLEEVVIEDTSLYATPNYWQLAKDMEALKTDSVVIFTNAFLKGLKGKRPTIHKPNDWIIFDTSQAEEHLINAVLKRDSITLLSALNTSNNLLFTKRTHSLKSPKIALNRTKDSIIIEQPNAQLKHLLAKEQIVEVLLYFEKKFTNQAAYLETALNTISKYLKIPINIVTSQDSTNLNISTYDRIIWLSEAPITKTHHKILSYKIDDLSQTMISKSDMQNVSYITQAIHPENILNKEFTQQLLAWLEFHEQLKKDLITFDNRRVSKAELLPIYSPNAKKSSLYIETWSLTKWICMALALLIIFERIIAHLRKQ